MKIKKLSLSEMLCIRGGIDAVVDVQPVVVPIPAGDVLPGEKAAPEPSDVKNKTDDIEGIKANYARLLDEKKKLSEKLKDIEPKAKKFDEITTAAEDQKKSMEQKLIESNQKIAEAEARAQKAVLKASLLQAGVNPEAADDATLSALNSIKFENGAIDQETLEIFKRSKSYFFNTVQVIEQPGQKTGQPAGNKGTPGKEPELWQKDTEAAILEYRRMMRSGVM
jgi:hypothetical protein